MIFSIGDLLTFVVVLLILVIYRAMDRNNRSLEKLKRFSDKISENLSSVVTQRTGEVRDLTLELQASLKTGKEILARARGVEELLQGRTADIEEIQNRFAQYDSALAELTAMSARVDKNLTRLRDESEYVEEVSHRIGESTQHLEAIEKQIPELRESLAERAHAEMEQATAEVMAGVESRVAALSAEVADVQKGAVAGIETRAAALSQQMEAAHQRVLSGVEEKASSASERLEEARDGFVASVSSLREDLSGRLAESEAKVKDFSTYVARLEARQEQTEKERLALMSRSLDEFDASLKGKLAGAAQRGASLEDEVFTRLSARIQEDEAAIAKSIQTIEMRLSDYQGDVDYRIKSLEESGQDVEALRESLSQSIEKAAAGVRSQMKTMGAELVAGWTTEIAAASAAREQVRAGTAELEQGLSALKAQAYQDVSTKLSVFEDEFFADLRERSTAMQERVKTWQADMEGRFTSFESDLKERITAADESLAGLREGMREETDKARKEASLAFEKELSGVKDALEAGTRRMHREIEAGLKELSVEMDAGRKEIADLFEGSRSEVSAWEAKSKQQLSETELSIAEKIAALSGEAAASIGAIRDGFAAQREDLLVTTNEERTALRAELAQMGESIASFRAELGRAADTGLETLRGQLDAFQLESQKRLRDLQADVENRIKEHRQQLTETREKTEAMQEKLFGKIDESSRILSTNVTEIDKRVKGFVSQTRLFERADTLKAALESTIEEMKKETSKLGADRSEVNEIELQLSRTKKLAEDVSAKLARFLAEKRRIDEMEGEFKKIVALSRDVDVKIDTLSSSNDALQQIQARVRQFEEMGKAVEGGFERLEKKREILSLTSEGVDRNFQRLESIEKGLKEADRSADELASKVQNMRGEYELLASNKADADSAVEIVGKLHGVMAELEERLEKAQSSREWMARTETRFEEIGRQAQEQVRLLESIIKAETKKEKPGRGAPPLDKRDTVVKLSHQGWSVQEISRVTQLSRGEVELILELAPKV
jgi:chromosome segregation ATPase